LNGVAHLVVSTIWKGHIYDTDRIIALY
jgi:hypothetical protein